jgi:DNA mismatch repair ATPase MutL
MVRASWRRHAADALAQVPTVSSSRRRPAFVINVATTAHTFDLLRTEHGNDVRFHDLDAVTRFFDALIAATVKGKRISALELLRLPGHSSEIWARATSSRKRSEASTASSLTAQRMGFRVTKRPRSFLASTGKLTDPDFEEALRSIPMPLTASAPFMLSRLEAMDLLARPSSAQQKSVPSSAEPRASTANTLSRPSSAAQITSALSRAAPGWTNPCYPSRGIRLASAIGIPSAACCRPDRDLVLDLRRVCISRDNILGLRVIGQSDLKFILVVDASSVLYAVDQHAASERAHYESLQRKAYIPNDGVCAVVPAIRTVVSLTARQVATSRVHKASLRQWGWELESLGLCTDSVNGSSKHDVMSIPFIPSTDTLIDRPDQLLAHLDGLAAGSVASRMPRPILDALALSACHTAVRFGDELTREQCISIVQALADCEMPFSCAHGRPSIVPLVIL